MESNRGDSTPFNKNELIAGDKDFKQFVSPQRWNIGKDFLRTAREKIINGDVDSATENLKKFSDLTGYAAKTLDKGLFIFGSNPYIKNNLKYIRDISLDYNMNTIRNYMYEAQRRGLIQQAERYQELLDIAQQSSITSEAAVEVSAHLDKMLSKIRYMDNPSGISRLDLAKFSEIQKKYAIDKESIDEKIASQTESFGKMAIDFAKGTAAGAFSIFPLAIDLASNVVTFLTDKPIPSATEYLMKKVGVDTNSYSYFLGNLTTFAFGGEFAQAAKLAQEGAGIAKSLSVFNRSMSAAELLGKYYRAAGAYLLGSYGHKAAEKALSLTNIGENRKEAGAKLAGAAATYKAYKSNYPSRLLEYIAGRRGGSSGRSYTRGSGGGSGGDSGYAGSGTLPRSPRPDSPRGGGGGDLLPRTPQKSEFVDTGNGEIFEFNSVTGEFIGKVDSDVFLASKEKAITVDAGTTAAIEAIEQIESMESKFSKYFGEFMKGANPESFDINTGENEGIILDTPENYKNQIISSMESDPRQNISGESFQGAYIDKSPNADGSYTLKNINPYNIEAGAENITNYNRTINQDGTTVAIQRPIEDIAKVIDQQALKIASESVHNDLPQIDSGIEIIPYVDKVEIKNSDEILSKFSDALISELPRSKLDALNMERGSSNILLTMLKANNEDIRAMGTAASDIISLISLGSDTNAQIVNDFMLKTITANKNSIFDTIGINERQIDLSQLRDERYTGNIAKSAVAEVKELINAKFNPYFTGFKQSIDSFANTNPVQVQVALDNITDILEKLNETGRSLNKETKDLYYETILKKISTKAQGTKFQEIPNLLKDLLRIEIPEGTKGISGIYRRSLGERLMLVRRYLRSAAQMYDSDTVAGFDASVGAFGDFKTEIYNPIDSIINELMRLILGEDYSKFEEVNKAYADYATTRQKIYKVLTDKNISGEKVWRELSSKPYIIRELLSHISGESIKVDSNISKLKQIILADIIRPILNIDADGNVVFHMTDQKQLEFGKRADLKELLNDEQISILKDAAINSAVIHNYERFRKNNSNTENLRAVRAGIAGNTLSQQIQTIVKSDTLTSVVSFGKSIAKITKKIKIQGLNKLILIFNATVSLIQKAADYVTEAALSDLMTKIVHLIVDPAMQSLILSKASESIKKIGISNKPSNNEG